jgi:uncharacterized protein YihD (DUF1040 family)
MKFALGLCPALVFGNHDADDVILLQMGHKARTPDTDVKETLSQLATTKSPHQAQVLLEKIAKAVVTGAATIDDSTKAVLEGVKKTFEETSKVAITDAHNNDMALLNSIASSTVADCASKYETNKEEDKHQGSETSKKESKHQTCHTDLDTLEVEKNEKCDAFESFRKTLSPPSCTVPGSTDGLVDYLSDSQAFFTMNLQQAQALDAACKDAIERRDAKKVSCNNLQVQFEMNFCIWRSESYETCYSYNTCYEGAATSLDNAAKNAQANEESRKLEWTALQKIECYIDVLISAEETEKRQEAMDGCKVLEPDTSDLNIVVPELAAPDACDLSPVAEFPCTDGFLSRYDGMSGVQVCTSCPDLEPHLQQLSPAHVWTGTSTPPWPLSIQDEFTDVTHLHLMPESEVANVQKCLQDVSVDTDLTFRVQRDDSHHASFIKYIRKDTGAFETFSLRGGNSDHTRLEFDGTTLTCPEASGSERCNSLPTGAAVEVILVEVKFQPREAASAHKDQWQRNKYSVSGSKYNVVVPASCAR